MARRKETTEHESKTVTQNRLKGWKDGKGDAERTSDRRKERQWVEKKKWKTAWMNEKKRGLVGEMLAVYSWCLWHCVWSANQRNVSALISCLWGSIIPLLHTGQQTGRKLLAPGKQKIKEIHRENQNNAFSALELVVTIILTQRCNECANSRVPLGGKCKNACYMITVCLNISRLRTESWLTRPEKLVLTKDLQLNTTWKWHSSNLFLMNCTGLTHESSTTTE